MNIGILTVGGSRGFSGNRVNFKDLIRTGRRMGIPVYVVPIEEIDLQKKTCTGYTWKTEWKQKKIPIPAVFYNRISTRQAERRIDVRKLKQELEAYRIPLFNPNFFDKRELYEFVRSHEETNHLLPETVSFGVSELEEMLDRHGKVYIKPVQSKAGKGIIRIDKMDNSVFVHVQKAGQRITRRTSVSNIYQKLARDHRNNGYVIQKGIALAKIEGRPYDLRVLVQKNKTGEWGLTGIGARVAPLHGIMTHVPNGGSIRPVEEALQSSFTDAAEAILMDVKNQSLLLANVIEGHTPGLLGEMSIDIGVDKTGKPWFFEANSKPMKFDEPNIREMSLRNIMEFCMYLSHNTKAGAP